MVRPSARELTERELEIMHVFWEQGEATIGDVRDALASSGLDRAYTTVATLVRILNNKDSSTQSTKVGLHVPAARSFRCVATALGRHARAGLQGVK